MGSRTPKNKKESRKLKLLLKAGQLQRILSGRSGAWFLEPSGDQHDLETPECLKVSRSKESGLPQVHDDKNDEFERDPVGF